MGYVNVEIKAKCSDLERLRGILRSESADFRGTDHQVDTYFKVSAGRLKLREDNAGAHLIFYERENRKGPKQSDVTVFTTTQDSVMKEILAKSLGVLLVVDKMREAYLIDNVKFHLDSVKGLGTFMEIEAMGAGDRTREELLEQCNSHMERLGIREEDLMSGSYSDMLGQGNV